MDMLTPILNSESKIPLYHQLYTFIRSEIRSGKIPSQTKLPSKRKLSAYLNVSQNTIQAAYDQLMEEGYIVPMERKGFFVNQLDHMKTIRLPRENQQNPARSGEKSHLFDFSYHGVDLPTFPFGLWRKLMKDVINEYDEELLQPGDSLGFLQLRQAVAQYLHQSRGVHCTKEQIIISSGTELLFQTLIQLLHKDSIYGIENPGYEKLNQLFIGNRADFRSICIDRKGMILEEIQKSKANILCITPAHQFPSGEIMPINRRIQLLNWANEDDNRYLIEDDYDSEFKFSGKPVPALQGLDGNEKVIYMGSMSKSLSPTIRVSYMVLPTHLMKRYQDKLSYILCPVPVIDQKVLYYFIRDGYFERHLNKMRNVYKRKRELLIKNILDLHSNIQILGADAGLHLLVTVENQMSEQELITAAYRQGVKVYGISKYYFDKSSLPAPPTILLGYAAMSEHQICEAVDRLYQAWFSVR